MLNKTNTELEARELQLIKLTRSLSEWHNRKMSRKDRQFFYDLYASELDAITVELMSREKGGN